MVNTKNFEEKANTKKLLEQKIDNRSLDRNDYLSGIPEDNSHNHLSFIRKPIKFMLSTGLLALVAFEGINTSKIILDIAGKGKDDPYKGYLACKKAMDSIEEYNKVAIPETLILQKFAVRKLSESYASKIGGIEKAEEYVKNLEQ